PFSTLTTNGTEDLPSVPAREGTPAPPQPEADDRPAGRMSRAAADDDLLLGPRSADPAEDDRRVAGFRAPGRKPCNERKVSSAPRGGLQGRPSDIRVALPGCDVP